jgi:hypothetical protein
MDPEEEEEDKEEEKWTPFPSRSKGNNDTNAQQKQ